VIKDKLIDDNNINLVRSTEDYFEWKIYNWNILKNKNQSLKSPNFRIGKSIWYIALLFLYLYII